MNRLKVLALLGLSVILFAACSSEPVTDENAVEDDGTAVTEEAAVVEETAVVEEAAVAEEATEEVAE